MAYLWMQLIESKYTQLISMCCALNIFSFICCLFVSFSADWYKDILTDKQLDELENPPTTTEKPKVKKVSSRRKHPKLSQRQRHEERESERLAEELFEKQGHEDEE